MRQWRHLPCKRRCIKPLWECRLFVLHETSALPFLRQHHSVYASKTVLVRNPPRIGCQFSNSFYPSSHQIFCLNGLVLYFVSNCSGKRAMKARSPPLTYADLSCACIVRLHCIIKANFIHPRRRGSPTRVMLCLFYRKNHLTDIFSPL